ncbi:MAG: Imm51 family immunity protein, partial [Rhodopirellula sp. JB044]|uniref:Imm51 family immunity protein n=1 Tax=Rhodopirellula sp. JB044 TaxID=3342844 RepID=UPI00370A6665
QLENSGYFWTDVVKQHCKKAPGFLKKVKFDSESSMFCVVSKHMDCVKAIHRFFKKATEDNSKVEELLSKNPDIVSQYS